ncbi:hypothetical protein J437_LFUL002816 [Ladona fulva]|uniref:Chordin n=1 Tax=Ladona fulva TaxID=123851 RepID=A0A8K0K5M9_LADFU|nr:hypothetical protein J437_LFUL002816 [Ladona fulva]
MRNMKEAFKDFAALLTGRTTQGDPETAAVATGRFTFHRRGLFYSFYHSTYLPPPKKLHFMDPEGSILVEHELALDTYQNITGKICGVWRRIPRSYRKLLREGNLHVALIWDRPTGRGENSDTLSGKIERYKALPTEMFSALLEAVDDSEDDDSEVLSEDLIGVGLWGRRMKDVSSAPRLRGAGGTAIVSASAGNPSIHITLVFNGAFSPLDVADVPVIVRLRSDKVLVFEEFIRVPKPDHEINIIEVRSAVKAADLRLLARGRLQITVSSKKYPEYRLKGTVTTRVTCDLFQASLLPSPYSEGDDPSLLTTSSSTSMATAEAPPPARASGLAWMFLTRDGALVYKVRLDDMDAPLISLGLASGRAPGQRGGPPRRHETVEDLTPSFREGWANGSLDRLSPRELEQLYAGEVWVTAVADSGPGATAAIKGRLTVHPAAGARSSEGPILLKRNDISAPAALTGIAWVAVDSDCTLLYEVSLSGLEDWVGPGDRPLNLYLEDTPAMVPGAPVARKLLDEFRGPQLEGFTMNLSESELARIEYGVAVLEVVDPSPSATLKSLLRARITQVHVPLSCLPPTSNSLSSQDDNQLPNSNSCYFEGSFYNEGDQWNPSRDSCMMCSCHHRQVKCDPILCPPPSCPRGVTPVKRAGDCCPSCTNSTGSHESNTSETQGCYLAKQFYKAGTSWHPYVPPFGFDTCAICTCDAVTLEVRCPRTQCPPLRCPEREAFRPDKKACCKECPQSSSPSQDVNQLKDQGTPRSTEEIMAAGGCIFTFGVPFENGKEWHPRIHPHGEEKCVKCRCKVNLSFFLSTSLYPIDY